METTIEILRGAEQYDANNYPAPHALELERMMNELEQRIERQYSQQSLTR